MTNDVEYRVNGQRSKRMSRMSGKAGAFAEVVGEREFERWEKGAQVEGTVVEGLGFRMDTERIRERGTGRSGTGHWFSGEGGVLSRRKDRGDET